MKCQANFSHWSKKGDLLSLRDLVRFSKPENKSMSVFSWQALKRAWHGVGKRIGFLSPEEHLFLCILLDIGLDIVALKKRPGTPEDYKESQELMETLQSPLIENFAVATGRTSLLNKMIETIMEIQRQWGEKASS